MVIDDRIVRELADGMGGERVRTAMTAQGVARKLERDGFLRSVAGDADFDRLVRAIMLATQMGRGIIFTGGNGVGKSRAMNAVWRGIPSLYKSWIDCADADRLAELGEAYLLDHNVFIDDFGAERMLYGDNDVVGGFIVRWHLRHPKRFRLYVTTNLTSDEIDARCGGRVLDRIKELCVICAFEGKSKRKAVVV